MFKPAPKRDPLKVRLKPTIKRQTHHHPRCRCPHCAPQLDFDGRKAAEKTEIERLRAELAVLKENQRAKKEEEKAAARRDIEALHAKAAAKLKQLGTAAVHAAADPRLKRLIELRRHGMSLAAAIDAIDREEG